MGNATTWLMFLGIVLGLMVVLGGVLAALIACLLSMTGRLRNPQPDNPFQSEQDSRSPFAAPASDHQRSRLSALPLVILLLAPGGLLGGLAVRLGFPVRGIPMALGALAGACVAGIAAMLIMAVVLGVRRGTASRSKALPKERTSG